MSYMHGADVLELRRLAGQFRATADEIDGEGSMMTRILGNVTWFGDVATRFTGDWTGIHLPKIGLSTRFLREAADQLDRNADEQETASGAQSGSLPRFGTSVGDASGELSTIERRLEANEQAARAYLAGLDPDDPFRRVVEHRLDQGFELYHFDPVRGHLAWSTGNLADATKVVVTVPGTGANWENVSGGFLSEGGHYLRGQLDDTAVITTMVWTPPSSIPDAGFMSEDVATMSAGPMAGMLTDLSSTGRDIVLVGHSAGAAAVQHLLTADPGLVDHIDGVALLAPGDLDASFPGIMGDKPVFVGIHGDDPINLSYADDAVDLAVFDRSPNVTSKVIDSGTTITPGTAGTIEDAINGNGFESHAHEGYANHFYGDVQDLFPGTQQGPDGMVGNKYVDDNDNVTTVWTGTF